MLRISRRSCPSRGRIEPPHELYSHNFQPSNGWQYTHAAPAEHRLYSVITYRTGQWALRAGAGRRGQEQSDSELHGSPPPSSNPGENPALYSPTFEPPTASFFHHPYTCTVRPPASNAARSHHALDPRPSPISKRPRRSAPPSHPQSCLELPRTNQHCHLAAAVLNLLLMTTTPEASRRAATSPYTPVAAHELRRQVSMPAALAATFASCGSGGGHGWPRNLGDDDDGSGDGRRAPRPAAGGVGAVVRALRAWIARDSRRKPAVVSRSGSSVKEQQYGHEEYAQNFDEGGAAGEPENLSRSFSARYARQAPWDVGARRRGRG